MQGRRSTANCVGSGFGVRGLERYEDLEGGVGEVVLHAHEAGGRVAQDGDRPCDQGLGVSASGHRVVV